MEDQLDDVMSADGATGSGGVRDGRPRRRRNAQAWAVMLAQHRDSELSVAAFCRQREVSVASFYLWRRRLREACEPQSNFVRLEPSASPSPMGTTVSPAMIEARFPCGVLLRCPAEHLRELLSGLIEATAGAGPC